MAINKVKYGNKTLIDLTDSTVTAETLMEGCVAYDKSGKRIVGTLKVPKTDKDLTYPYSYSFQYSKTKKDGYIYGI